MKKVLLLFIISFTFLSINAQVFIDENFENGLPADWFMFAGWNVGTAAELQNIYVDFTKNTTKMAGYSGAATGAASNFRGKVITSYQDFTSTPNVLLQFELYYWNLDLTPYGGSPEEFNIYYSEDEITWTKIKSATKYYNFDKFTWDISSAVGGKNVKLAFEYYCGGKDYLGAAIDNILVMAQPDYFITGYPQRKDFAQIDNRGDEQSFNVNVEYYGKEILSNYKLVYKIDGGEEKEILGTNSLSPNGTTTFTVPGFELDDHVLTSKIVFNDTLTVNLEEKTYYVFPPVTPFVQTDVDGVEHDIYEDLKAGKKVLLDFFASWCIPCKESTPLLNAIWVNHGSGTKDFQAYGITTYSKDDDAKVRGLDWGGEYPTFGYNSDGRLLNLLYDSRYGANAIPFFVMICPNPEDPAFSTISWTSIGYDEAGIESAISNCIVDIARIDFADDSLTVSESLIDEVKILINVENTGSKTGEVFWKLKKNQFNLDWTSSFCDNNLCYPSGTDENPSNKPNTFNAGFSKNWELKIYANGVAGSADLVLELYSDSDFTSLVGSLPIAVEIGLNATIDFADINLSIAPNPASDYFKINSTENISTVEVFNLIGKKVKTFDYNNSNKYNISDLRNGIYLVRVNDAKNNTLKVVRLNVNHLRP